MELDGRVAIVTGGTRGIGRAAALALAKAGAKVCVAGRGQADAEAAAEAIRAAGGEAVGVAADVAQRGDVERLFAAARQAFGPVTVVVAAAGVWATHPLGELTDEAWDAMMAVHVKGTLYCMQAALADMAARGGSIVTISSPAATVGSNFKALHYAAAKGSILAMTKSAAKELARHRITVNCISPAARTDMFDMLLAQAPNAAVRDAYLTRFPLGVPEADDIAGVFVFLASDAARALTGQVLNADGGFVM